MLGAGPAGLAAGIYGARSRLRVGLVTKGPIGGQAVTTAELENYPGFGRGSTGPQVIEALMKHAREMGAEFIFDEIDRVEIEDELKRLRGRKGEYRASMLILAPGANPRLLGVPGEKELWGRGVSYCATCDAELYEDRRVAVVGSGDAAIEEALYLTRFASQVSVLVLHDRGRFDANPAAHEKAQGNPRISWVWNCQVERIIGRERVEGVSFRDLKSGETHELPVDGVFIFIGTLPQTEMLKGLIDLDENGYIITDDRMRTSAPGVYAAGDARSKYLRQVVTAVADGAVAAVAAERHLEEWRFFSSEVLQSKSPVLVGYYHPQSRESLEALQQAEALIRERGRNLRLIRFDVSRSEMLVERFKISSVPMFQLFAGGKLRLTVDGFLKASQIENTFLAEAAK